MLNNLQLPGFTYELQDNSFPSTLSLAASTNHDSFKLIQELESTTGLKFGSSENPLFLAVQKECDTTISNAIVLNIGLNDEVVEKLADTTNPVFAHQCYRLFLETFATAVLEVPPRELSTITDDRSALDAEQLKELVNAYRDHLRSLGHVIPQDPWEQLSLLIQKISKQSTDTTIKVQACLISDIHHPLITIDPSDKTFVTSDHVFHQNPTLLQFNLSSVFDAPPTLELEKLVKELNCQTKSDLKDDVILLTGSDPLPEPTSPWITKVTDNWSFIGTQRNFAIGLSCFVLVILAFLLFFFLRSSSPTTFLLSGLVTSDSVPLSGVLVFGDKLKEVYTDNDGLFELEPLENGEYELSFQLSGYDPKSVSVVVSDSHKFIDVSLVSK
ncbi:hypothetical protein GEMRC1_002169 [Eukaryota sp. GEM-RC1]